MAHRSFSDVQLLAALAKYGTTAGVAASLGVSVNAVKVGRRRLGIAAPHGGNRTGRGPKPHVPPPAGKVEWNEIARTRLAAMVLQTPRPSAAEMAITFGTTEAAINTALVRNGLTIPRPEISASMAGRRRRQCISCGRLFMSAGPGNRRCLGCKSVYRASMVA